MSATGRGSDCVSTDEVRAIPGWDAYKASRSGLILSTITNKCMAMYPTRDGYLRVQLWRNNKGVLKAVHTLIAITFIGPRPGADYQIRHLDGNKTNNSITNIQWGTATENARDRAKHGRTIRGEKSRLAKLTNADIPIIREKLIAGITQRSIAKEYNVSIATIGHIKSRRNWGWL